MRPFRSVSVVCVIAATFTVSSCSAGPGLCDGVRSVAQYVTGFQQGLDNFSEDQYNRLRMDTLDALDTVRSISDMTGTTESALLAGKIEMFVAAMDDSEWDVTVALSSATANRAASALGTPETLGQANVVEAAVIDRCGLPTTVEQSDRTGETLPSPVIPAPTQTDPPTDTIDQASEDESQGRMVATLFGLTLSQDKVVCLGRALQDVTDLSSAGANLAQYQGQFQKAFDSCNIAFTVPKE